MNWCGDSHYEGQSCMESPGHYGNHRSWSTVEHDDQPWFMEWPNDARNLNVWRTTHCKTKYGPYRPRGQ